MPKGQLIPVELTNVWRPEPKPDVRLYKLTRGLPLPGGCFLKETEAYDDQWWLLPDDVEPQLIHDIEVWYKDDTSEFSVSWDSYVILTEDDRWAGTISEKELNRTYLRVPDDYPSQYIAWHNGVTNRG